MLSLGGVSPRDAIFMQSGRPASMSGGKPAPGYSIMMTRLGEAMAGVTPPTRIVPNRTQARAAKFGQLREDDFI